MPNPVLTLRLFVEQISENAEKLQMGGALCPRFSTHPFHQL